MADEGHDFAEFEGFEIPASNYFRMPNAWTDITARIDSLAELKVVEYILRHTWGYQEYGIAKHITLDEFVNGRRRRDGTRMDRGTGLSERAVRIGIEKALGHKLISQVVDDSDRGRVKRYFSLRMRTQGAESGWHDVPPSRHDVPPSPEVVPPRPAQRSTRSEKDTSVLNHEKGTALRALWTAATTELSETMTDSNYRSWIEPLQLVELANSHAVISAPDATVAEYVEKRLSDRVASALGVERIEVRTSDRV